MSGSATKEEDKEEVASQGPRGWAEVCQSMMTDQMGEHCGSQMRDMMSRCMARFRVKQEQPR